MENGLFLHDNTVAPKSKSVLALFSLKGKTAIVSGAGDGIGLAVARGYAEAGANVVIWYNKNEKAHDRAKEIADEYGVKCKAYQVDVRDAKIVDDAVVAHTKEFNNRLDVFVANAGIPWIQGSMIDGDIDHYYDVMKTDVDGVYFCARVAGRIWREQKTQGLENFTAGSFIATASMSGHITNIPQLQSSYNAAKASVIQLCKGFSVEWARFARANTVSPGYIATDISKFVPESTKDIWRDKTPMGREGEPQELVGAYLYLASDASSFTTGSDIIVDGGYCVP